MKGYLAFPPPTSNTSTPAQLLIAEEPTGACATWSNGSNYYQACHDTRQPNSNGVAQQALEKEQQKRRDLERTLGERSEIEWVRAGGVLRDVFGKRDKTRTEQIRQELRVQDVERERMARWEAYETRWRVMQSSTTPVTFVEFPWPLKERVSSCDLSMLTHCAVSEFLFESLAVRANTMTRRERIRSSFLRWHPDKMSLVLNRVVCDDLELVREGIHVVFGILKALQDSERTGIL